jgi:hypothetical protein
MPRASRRAVVAAALVVLLTACGASGMVQPLPEPRDGRSGLQLTGTFGGRQLAVSDGLPDLLVRECSVRHGIPAEVCFATRAIDGTPVVVGLANADVVADAEQLTAGRARCDTMARCAQVADQALVFVRVDDEVRQATGGSVAVHALEPGSRYAGELRLQIGRDRLSGTFDVVPRPEPGAGQG